MRILYAVQGTGNGHIARARVMAPALRQAGIQADYLFSGRDADGYFDMQSFGDYQIRRGLTLFTEAGRVNWHRTLLRNALRECWADIRRLDLSGYDLVLTDFEPIAAWAARRQKRRCIGLAHQYALCHRLPGTERAPLLRHAISLFAPTDLALGVHWQPFDAPILPPLILPQPFALQHDASRMLVYLPFEDPAEVRQWLLQFPDYRFHIYLKVDAPYQDANLTWLPLSREGFQRDLASCGGVICNAGFGLCSEAMQSGKRLLVKPLQGQVEQYSNAVILEQMGRGTLLQGFDPVTLRDWLQQPPAEVMRLPDVAGHIARWLSRGAQESPAELAATLWQASSGCRTVWQAGV